jgi:hypothetical protein
MNNALLTKNYTAEAAISPYRIVKWGAADSQVLQATGVADKLIGIQNEVGPALGERADVQRAGIAEVEYGGNVVRGDPLTSDATGKALAAAPAAGTNNYIIGFAEVSGAAGDIGLCLIAPGRIQG